MAEKPKLLFAVSNILGWRTYAARLRDCAGQRADFTPIFKLFDLSIWQRAALALAPRGRRLFDQIQIFDWSVSSWWRSEGQFLGVDAIHAATPACAAAFTRLEVPIPYSLGLDVTRPLSTRDLKQYTFSGSAIERERALLRGAESVAAMSRWAANSVMMDAGVPSDRILVIPPSVNVTTMPFREKKPSGGLVRLLFVGNDFKRKGGDRLVIWHQQHFRDHTELHIVSKQAPVDIGLKNIVWHRSLPYTQLVNEVFPLVDIFCLPTRSDMSPWVLAEASACGLPAVTFDIGGISDLCVDGQTGFVLKRDDFVGYVAALERLIEDAPLRIEMGRAARRHAEANLDAPKKYGALFDRMISSVH